MKLFSDESKKILKLTLQNYGQLISDIVLTTAIAITMILFREEILAKDILLIVKILMAILLAHFINNFIKTYLKYESDIEYERKVILKKYANLLKVYGREFDSILGAHVRTTIYEEKLIKDQLYLVILARFNTYKGDKWSTKWKISHNSNKECEGITGESWGKTEPVKKPRLPSREELCELLKSNTDSDRKKLKGLLDLQRLSLETLESRLGEPDRDFLFPRFIFAQSVLLENNKKLVVVVDSDKKTTQFRQNFLDKMNEFLSLLSKFHLEN